MPRLTVGSGYLVEGNTLFISPRLLFELPVTRGWDERCIVNPNEAIAPAILQTRIDTLFDLIDTSRAKEMGRLIPAIHAHIHDKAVDVIRKSKAFFNDRNAVLATGAPLIMDIVRDCTLKQSPDIAQLAVPLIGFGTGLTPSGDDFLGGFLFSGYAMRKVYGRQGISLAEESIDNFSSRTNLISYTLIKDLNLGHGVEPIHDLVNDLFSDIAMEKVEKSGLSPPRRGSPLTWEG